MKSGSLPYGKALTWNELADEYDRVTGGHARTLKMETVFRWAKKQTDKFVVSPECTIHKVIQEKENVA